MRQLTGEPPESHKFHREAALIHANRRRINAAIRQSDTKSPATLPYKGSIPKGRGSKLEATPNLHSKFASVDVSQQIAKAHGLRRSSTNQGSARTVHAHKWKRLIRKLRSRDVSQHRIPKERGSLNQNSAKDGEHFEMQRDLLIF